MGFVAMAGATAILLLATTSASASTVSVQETPGDTNQVLLTYQASTGEDNHLTITTVGKGNGYWELHVVDPGASITADFGCSGGGLKGTEATCTMHEPKGFDYGSCSGHDCIPPTIPATAWKINWTIALGDGDNYFDGSAFTGIYDYSIAMTVSGGAGEDQILTGAGNDTIDPGAGSDQVKGGDGADLVDTTAVADGSDRYEETDEVSYEHRNEPISLEGGTAGAAGENDRLVGVIYVIGGSADDRLVGGPGYDRLEGGRGNDALLGRDGNDDLYGGPGNDDLSGGEGLNHLIGEEGNDVYSGGAGIDIVPDSDPHPPLGGFGTPIPSPEGGDDVAYGEGGDDAIELGVGNDHAFGGPGDDDLDGGAGHDFVSGGNGHDGIVGGKGFDRISGGAGPDLIFSGRWGWSSQRHMFPFPGEQDDGPDSVRCGRGRDIASSNPWDRLHSCEVAHFVRP